MPRDPLLEHLGDDGQGGVDVGVVGPHVVDVLPAAQAHGPEHVVDVLDGELHLPPGLGRDLAVVVPAALARDLEGAVAEVDGLRVVVCRAPFGAGAGGHDASKGRRHCVMR